MQLIDRRTDQAASAASSPVDRIAKALAYLLRRADIEPAEFAALLAQHSGPREGLPSEDSGGVALEDDLVIHATAILATWYQDPQYVDDHADPLSVPLDGKSPSVRALFDATRRDRAYGDAEFKELARRLEAHGSIERLDSGQYRPIKRTFAVNAMGPAMIALLARLAGFIETVAFNAEQGGRFERIAKVSGFPADAVPLVIAALEDEGMQFLEQIDGVLESKRDASKSAGGTGTKELGVGVYLLERDE